MLATESEPIESLPCENCSAEVNPNQKFCSQCSFPANGTEDEKRSFRLLVSSRKRFLKDANEKIKSGKTIIYVLAGLYFVFGLFFGLVNDDIATMVVYLVCTIIYLILAAWSSKNPFGAILTALIIYVTIHVLAAIVEPASIFSGIILKIIFISAFVKGIRSAQEAQKYLAELGKLKAVPVGI